MYFTNSTVCLCEWMTCPARSKWGALLCGPTVTSYGLWQKACWGFGLTCQGTTPVAQTVKRLPTMRETQVQPLGQEDILEKEMSTHASTLAWKIPWMEEPGRLQSMKSQRVRHDWATSVSFTFWRREWQPTPVFLPGEPHGQRDLVVYNLWGCKDLDTTERRTLSLSLTSNWSLSAEPLLTRWIFPIYRQTWTNYCLEFCALTIVYSCLGFPALIFDLKSVLMGGIPSCHYYKESSCHCRSHKRCWLYPWVWKMI